MIQAAIPPNIASNSKGSIPSIVVPEAIATGAAILKFKYYLEEEAAQGRVIMDENNQPMQVKMVG